MRKSVLFTFSLLLFPLFAEEWGIAFSGKILAMRDGTKETARVGGSENYTTNVFIRLYDSAFGADQPKTQALWGRKITVHTRKGCFSCELRDANGEKLNAAYERLQDAFAHLSGGTMTVGVTPYDDNRYDEISPRQTLISAPYAVHAGDALGTVGDVTVGEKLTVGGGRAPVAAFNGPVVHEGSVTFDSLTTLRSLSLNDSESFTASTLEVEKDVAVSTARADEMTAGTLTASVGSVTTAVFSNLTLTGSSNVQSLTAPGGVLAVEGALSVANKLTCTNLVIGGSFDFFKWDKDVGLLKGGGESSGKTQYIGGPESGSWTVPKGKTAEQDMGGDLFVSLSFRLKQPASDGNSSSLTVSVDGQKVATLSRKGGGNCRITLPFQAFLRRGQTISWVGQADDLTFYYRLFTY